MTQEEIDEKAQREAAKASCDELYNACTDKEKLFVDAYVKRPNKAKAAIACGCETNNPAQSGWNIYSRPHVKAAITALQDMLSVSTRDVVKMVKDIAESNLADYYTKTVMVRHTPQIEVSIRDYIRRLKWRIEDTCLLFSKDLYNELETAEMANNTRYIRREILKAEIEMERNPAATRVIYGPETLVPEKVLNVDDLIADKERGRVKKVKINKDGSSEFELYSADAAHERLLRRAGEYEKDNRRVIAVAKPVIMDWGDGDDTADYPDSGEIQESIITNPEILD